jgi:hypothetical protein
LIESADTARKVCFGWCLRAGWTAWMDGVFDFCIR